MDNILVRQEAAKSRFVTEVDGLEAELVYRLVDGRIEYLHTGVPSELEGRGIGSRLAKTGLEYAQKHGLTVVPRCSFIADYVGRHAEYRSLLPEV